MPTPTFLDHLLAIVLGILLPLLAALGQWRNLRGEPLNATERAATWWANSAAMWAVALAVCACWLLTGRGLGALGLRAPEWDHPGATIGLVLALVLFYLFDLWSKVGSPARLERTRARWRGELSILPQERSEVPRFTILALSAGVSEELAFRGHLIPYVATWTGTTAAGLALAVLVPALPFALAHIYQGAFDAAKTMVVALLLGGLLVVTGSLWLPIALHVAVNLASCEIGLRYGRA